MLAVRMTMVDEGSTKPGPAEPPRCEIDCPAEPGPGSELPLPLHAASASTASPTTASLNFVCMIEVVLFLKYGKAIATKRARTVKAGPSRLREVTDSLDYGVCCVHPPILLLQSGCIANLPVDRVMFWRFCHAHASPISPRLPAHAVFRLTCGSVWLSA